MVISEAFPLLMEPLVSDLTRTDEGFTSQWENYNLFIKIMENNEPLAVVIKIPGNKTGWR